MYQPRSWPWGRWTVAGSMDMDTGRGGRFHRVGVLPIVVAVALVLGGFGPLEAGSFAGDDGRSHQLARGAPGERDRIAFTRYAHDTEVRVVAVESGDHQLVSGNVTRSLSPAWLLDGNRVAFESEGGLYIADADGFNLQALTQRWSAEEGWMDSSRPVSSPGGTLVAFIRDGDVFVVGANGADLRRLTHDDPSLRSRDHAPVWSPDGSRIAYTTYHGGERDSEIAVVGSLGTNQLLLTDNSHEEANPVWSPDSSRIAFDSDRGGGSAVYVMMADGSDVRRLATGRNPDWSPDGSRIVFERERDVYVMKADGTDQQLLARGRDPVWSPDGSRIAFTSSRESFRQVFVMDGDGQNVRQATEGDYPVISGLVWSPDGSRIAFTVEYSTQLFVMEDDGGDQRRLTRHFVQLPWAWSADGTRIALWERGLRVVHPDGESQSQVLNDSGLDPAWSPDGTRVAFVIAGVLLVVKAYGADPPAVIHGGLSPEHPAWSPDGSRISFVGYRDGVEAVFVVGADGSNLRQVSLVTSQLDRPVWSPDGSRIAFADNGRVILVDPDDGARQDLADGEEPAWSPDGSRIAFTRYVRGRGYEIAVMDADGTNQQTLTNNRGSDASPDWSPDGSRIAFSSDRDGDNEIFTMRPDGSDVRQLTHNNYNDQNPKWAPTGPDAFADDEGGFFEPSLNALELRGILEMTECGERLVCPEDAMKRWVMAVWLVRVLDGADPVGVTTTRFVDVDPEEWWMPFVERLAELGVTEGCELDPAEYCPEEPVTRAQMATFLTRAFRLWRVNTARFVDTGGNDHEESIDALAGAGITSGCQVDPARFCPHAPLTRGQMATFLARALGLVALPAEAGGPIPRLAFTSSHGTYQVGHRVFLADADGRNLRQLTTIDPSRNPAWSPDGSQIAYVGADVNGLFVVDADLKNRERIVEGLWIRDPVWSPDGSTDRLCKRSQRLVPLCGGQTYGRNLSRLLQFPHRSPVNMAWSPDGSHIAFNTHVDRRMQVFVVDVATARLWQVTENASSQPHLEWSPDGSRIAFNGTIQGLTDGSSAPREAAFIVDKDGANLQQLSQAFGGREPVWSPDGSQIAFTQYEEGALSDLFVSYADGTNPRRLTNTRHGVYGLAWSPDGWKIAFKSVIAGGWEISVAAVDDADVRRLTHGSHLSVTDPVWSPDGRYIAFGFLPAGTSSRQEQWEIAVVNTDDGRVVRITDNQYEDGRPVWSPRIGGGE